MIVVNIIGITLLIVFLIFTTIRNKKVTDWLLITIILSFILYLGSNIWISNSLNSFTFLFQSTTAAILFFPFLIYSLLLISKSHTFKKKWLWFGLFDLSYLFFLYCDILLFNRLETYTIQELYLSPPTSYYLFYKAHGVYKILVLLWVLSELRRYKSDIKNHYSNIEEISLTWLQYFVWVYIGENFISTLVFIPFDLGYLENIDTVYLISNLVLVIAMFYLIYNGARQYSLANFNELRLGDISNSGKYKTSSLSDEVANDLYDKIILLFDEEKIFHNPELKVQDIAQRLDATNHNISQVLNQNAGKSFYEFVNDYRLTYFKNLLADEDKKRFTILALGMESGFNSKASLNRIFKQQLGQTPKEYQQQALAS